MLIGSDQVVHQEQQNKYQEVIEWITDKINDLYMENDSLKKIIEEKINQMNQNEKDIEDSYSKYIKQSTLECENYLCNILMKEEEKYIDDILKRINNISEKINQKNNYCSKEIRNLYDKIDILKNKADCYHNYINKMDIILNDKYINGFNRKRIDLFNNLNNKAIQIIKKQSNLQTYNKEYEKIKKYRMKVEKYENMIQKLSSEKQKITENINTLSKNLSKIQEQIIESSENSPRKKYHICNFEIFDQIPAYQKTQHKFGNLLVLAPMQSTRMNFFK